MAHVDAEKNLLFGLIALQIGLIDQSKLVVAFQAWTLDEARAETVRATRRFARRQESWFRRDPRVTWLAAAEADLNPRALSLIDRSKRMENHL